MFANIIMNFKNKLKQRRNIMMKKQEFVPRKISEKPLYELKSVEDIPVSELYQVKINGKEQ